MFIILNILVKASECYHDVEAALELEPTSQDALNIKSQLEQNTSIAKKQVSITSFTGTLMSIIIGNGILLSWQNKRSYTQD